jgi:hypothetical protein
MELEKYKWEAKYGCMWRHLPATYPAKAAPPFSSSNNRLHSCRVLIAENCGANNWTEQGSTHCSVWNSHKCPANTATKSEKYKQETKYGCVSRCLPAVYPAKAALLFSSSNNQLHSCRLSIAEKHGANNQQEQSKAVQPIQQPICRTNNITNNSVAFTR